MEQEKTQTMKPEQKNRVAKKKNMSVSMITKIALLSALAGVLMLFEAPLWFAPSFYKLDLSELMNPKPYLLFFLNFYYPYKCSAY